MSLFVWTTKNQDNADKAILQKISMTLILKTQHYQLRIGMDIKFIYAMVFVTSYFESKSKSDLGLVCLTRNYLLWLSPSLMLILNFHLFPCIFIVLHFPYTHTHASV